MYQEPSGFRLHAFVLMSNQRDHQADYNLQDSRGFSEI